MEPGRELRVIFVDATVSKSFLGRAWSRRDKDLSRAGAEYLATHLVKGRGQYMTHIAIFSSPQWVHRQTARDIAQAVAIESELPRRFNSVNVLPALQAVEQHEWAAAKDVVGALHGGLDTAVIVAGGGRHLPVTRRDGRYYGKIYKIKMPGTADGFHDLYNVLDSGASLADQGIRVAHRSLITAYNPSW